MECKSCKQDKDITAFCPSHGGQCKACRAMWKRKAHNKKQYIVWMEKVEQQARQTAEEVYMKMLTKAHKKAIADPFIKWCADEGINYKTLSASQKDAVQYRYRYTTDAAFATKEKKRIQIRKHTGDYRLIHSRIRMQRVSSTSDGSITKSALEQLMNDATVCPLCNDVIDMKSVDHIIPLSKGGTHTLSNIQITCLTCNVRKGSRVYRAAA